MISKKRLKKTHYSLVVKINQMQTHYFSKKEDCKSAKTDNATKRFQKQKLKPYSKFVNKNIQQKRKVLTIEREC